MSLVHRFEYVRPGSLAEVVRLLGEVEGAEVLAGGTDMVPNLKMGAVVPKLLIDIKGIESLRGIGYDGGVLVLGALVTFTEIMESDIIREYFPIMAENAHTVASVGVRNRATLGGNICSAVPCMDSGPLLSVFDAEMVALGPKGERVIPAEKFFVAPRKNGLADGEVLVSLRVKAPAEKHGGCFVKLRRYRGEDLAQASVIVLALPGNRYRVSFGSVAPVPVRAPGIEALLNGKELTPELIEGAKKLVPEAIAPITDIRATEAYRMHMSQVMLGRALTAAVQRLNGTGPAYRTELI